MEEKLKELMADASFCEELEKTNSPEEASALFAQHGIQITPEELLAAVAQPEGELDEKNLDEVAGGVFWRFPRFPFPIPKFPRWPHRPRHGGGGRSW